MRRRRLAWDGSLPADDAEARDRLMDAAIRCVARTGFEKTNMADIAAEAGVTRPTLYAYFPSRDVLLETALARAGAALAEQLVVVLRDLDDPAELVVEAMVFALRAMRSDASLALIFGPDSSELPFLKRISDEAFELARSVVETVVDRHPAYAEQADEATEVLLRFLFSLLTLEAREERDERALRAFLRRRMVPALALPSRPRNRK